jgi:hypothetical protein
MSLKVKDVTIKLKKDLRNNILDYDIEDIKKLYKIEYIQDFESIIYILDNIFNNNRKILKYCEKAMDNFNIELYEKYLEWRKENKFTSNTPEFFKLVYGDNWEYYFNNKKVTRIYDPIYIMNRDNCSYDDAINSINKMKKDKSTSLDGFIKRHGEERGKILYVKFKKTSNIFDKENIIRIHGEDKLDKIIERNYKSIRSNSKRCVDYWINRGFDEIESVEKVSEHQKYNSGVSKDAIFLRNVDDLKYAEYIYNNLNKKKDSSSFLHCLKICNNNYLEANKLYIDKCSKKNHRSIHNFKTLEEYIEYNSKISDKSYNTLISKFKTINRDSIDDFKKYCKRVNYYTNLNLRINGESKFGENYRSGIKVRGNHIDHIYSKYNGYLNSVDPEIIGHIENLQILNYKLNIKKNKESWIELEDLYFKCENTIYSNIKNKKN